MKLKLVVETAVTIAPIGPLVLPSVSTISAAEGATVKGVAKVTVVEGELKNDPNEPQPAAAVVDAPCCVSFWIKVVADELETVVPKVA